MKKIPYRSKFELKDFLITKAFYYITTFLEDTKFLI